MLALWICHPDPFLCKTVNKSLHSVHRLASCRPSKRTCFGTIGGSGPGPGPAPLLLKAPIDSDRSCQPQPSGHQNHVLSHCCHNRTALLSPVGHTWPLCRNSSGRSPSPVSAKLKMVNNTFKVMQKSLWHFPFCAHNVNLGLKISKTLPYVRRGKTESF